MGQEIDKSYTYSLNQLMEIAIKALSPGINDPGTAVISLQAIGYENDIEKAKEIISACFEEEELVVNDDVHVSFVAEDELVASTVNLKVYFWVTTEDFRRGTLQTRGRLIQKVKTRLEENGINLPAEIRELKFYEASNSFKINSTVENSTQEKK